MILWVFWLSFEVIQDFLQLISEPELWPLFLVFLGGYTMMRTLIKQKTLDKFSQLEKGIIAFGIGFLFVYLLFYPVVASTTFWFTPRDSAYINSVFLFCAVSAALLMLRIYGVKETDITKTLKNLLPLLMIFFSGLVVFSIILSGSILWYEPYILNLIVVNWWIFLNLSIGGFILFLFGLFFLWIYLLKPLLKEKLELGGTLKELKKKSNFLPAIALMSIVAIAGFSIVPLDRQFNLFTPRMEQIGEETFSSEMRDIQGFFKVVLFIDAFGDSPNYRFYALMNTQYKITLPRFRTLSSLYIANPSNTSFQKGTGAASVSSSEDWKVFIRVPENVTYEFAQNAGNVSGAIVSFANFTSDQIFFANVTYWQKIPLISGVEPQYFTPTFIDLGNQTWIEKHVIVIKNYSNNTLYVPAFTCDRFAYESVNRNSTKTYQNGNLIPYAELIWQTRLGLWTDVYPHSEKNFTITFLTYSIF
jgi:hypothetical protein